MKFISKSSNLLIVLRPGLSAQPLTGTPAVPTISVRFKDGVADVQNQELVDMMLKHPGFNSDFISADSVPVDPYAATRQSSEPSHVMTEIKFGTPVNRIVGKGDNTKLSPEVQKLIQDMAVEMAKKMLPSMVESTIKGIVESHRESSDSKPVEEKNKGIVESHRESSDSKPVEEKKEKGKPGRKPKAKVNSSEDIPQETSNPAIQESAS